MKQKSGDGKITFDDLIRSRIQKGKISCEKDEFFSVKRTAKTVIPFWESWRIFAEECSLLF